MEIGIRRTWSLMFFEMGDDKVAIWCGMAY